MIDGAFLERLFIPDVNFEQVLKHGEEQGQVERTGVRHHLQENVTASQER